ncbi:MAG: succinylglutamate desuccinylase [Lachnospiraceae bacterium]|nr:succinylglutamate desuccinylase [Lachnospiraceae bacterium]
MNMWKLCGQELEPGQKRQVILKPDQTDYELPATLICGKEPGKTLVVTAQIHAGEYNGTPAVIQTAREVDPGKLKGNLLLMHCVNTSGFWKQHWRTLPEDGFNLNSGYPGRPGGTAGERLADWFVKEIFPETDFLLDLHGGSVNEPLTPCLFFPKAEKVREVSLAAAKALDVPYLIASGADGGEYSYAAVYHDVPGLLLERGYGGFCRDEWIAGHKRNIYLLLRHLGMYESPEPEADHEPRVYEHVVYLESEKAGLWYPAVRENDRVVKGQLLGRLEDMFGNVVQEFYAEGDGVIFYYTGGLAVGEGDSLAAYGLDD